MSTSATPQHGRQKISTLAFAYPPKNMPAVTLIVKVLTSRGVCDVQAALLAQQEAQLAEQQRLQAAAAAAAASGFEQFPPADPSPAAAAPMQPGVPPVVGAPAPAAAPPAANGLPSARAPS